MTLTTDLKSWLTKHYGVPETASNDEFEIAYEKAKDEGELTPAMEKAFAEDCEDCDDDDDAVDTLSRAMAHAVKPLAEGLSKLGERMGDLEQRDASIDKLATAVGASIEAGTANGNAATKLLGGQDANVRVKGPLERYDSTHTAAVWPEGRISGGKNVGGMPAYYHRGAEDMPGEWHQRMDMPSQADLAVCGSYIRWCARGTGGQIPRWLRYTEHDEQIMKYAVHELDWIGDTGLAGTAKRRKLNEREIKAALLDGSTSGGQEAAPAIFDDAAILYPLLYGQLFPLVQVVPVARGRRMEGFSMANPTVARIAEGSAGTAFDATTMVVAFDTTIHPVVGWMEIGNDFEEDSPNDFGALIVQQYGRQMQAWLDNQICNGDGTTEPEGVLLPASAGPTDIGNPNGGAGAAPQVDDYETLWQNVALQYQPPQDRSRTVFIGSFTTYARARKIARGSADVARAFGMGLSAHTDMRILNWDFKVENNCSNANCGFFNMAGYRMYRRLGVQVQVTSEGKELVTKNMTLIRVRARYGGKLTLGGYGAYSDNWQA